MLLDTKIEYIDKDSGDVYLRSYGLKDGVIAKSGRFQWMSHSSDSDIYSFEKQPVILTPDLDHIVIEDSFEAWNEAQKPFGIGMIEKVVKNPKTGAFDFIWKTIDARAAEAAKEGYLTRFKVSPALWSENFTIDKDGVVHYKNYRGVHMAIVKPKNAAFGDELAVINDHVCIGGSKCVKELAAIASYSKQVKKGQVNFDELDPYEILKKNFILYTSPVGSSHDHLMEGNKEVSYEEYYKLKTDHEQAQNKLKDALELNKTLTDDKSKAEKRATTAESELETRRTEDKKKDFTEYFTVIHGKEAEDKIKTSVEQAISRKYEKKDLDELYGPIYEQKKAELEEIAKREKEETEGGIHAGVGSAGGSNGKTGTGSGSGNNNVNASAAIASARNEMRESAEIARGLFRRRV